MTSSWERLLVEYKNAFPSGFKLQTRAGDVFFPSDFYAPNSEPDFDGHLLDLRTVSGKKINEIYIERYSTDSYVSSMARSQNIHLITNHGLKYPEDFTEILDGTKIDFAKIEMEKFSKLKELMFYKALFLLYGIPVPEMSGCFYFHPLKHVEGVTNAAKDIANRIVKHGASS